MNILLLRTGNLLCTIFLILTFINRGLAQTEIWGVSGKGGENNTGTIYTINTATGESIIQFSFPAIDSQGHFPRFPPTLLEGKFYGTAAHGGANNSGVIYEWNPATGKYLKKIDFSLEKGKFPSGPLHLYNNKFYGATSSGGEFGDGVLFEWDPVTNEYEKKVDFEQSQGESPNGTLHLLDGKFYGLTYFGGKYGGGVIFEYDIAENLYRKRYDFDGIYGNDGHSGSLTLGLNKFYGMATAGGDNDTGYIFEWHPSTGTFFKGNSLPADFNSIGLNNLVYHKYNFYGVTKTGGDFGHGIIYTADLGGVLEQSSLQYSPQDLYISADKEKLYGIVFSNRVLEWDFVSRIARIVGDLPDGLNYANANFSFIPSTIYFEPIEPIIYGTEVINLDARASSGRSVKFSSSDESIAIVEGDKLKIKNVGTVTITAEELGDLSSSFAEPQTRTLIVKKAPLTIAALDTFKIYGDSTPSFKIQYSGFLNSDDPSIIDIEPVISTSANSTSNAGVYDIIVEGGTDDIYDLIYTSGNLSILKAPLKIVAEPQEKRYGEPIPNLSYKIEGFKYDDNAQDITPPLASTEAVRESDVGLYTIDLSGGEALNYEFIRVNSTLTVIKAPAEVLMSELFQIEDGTPKSPVVTTNPAGLETELFFNNSSTLPLAVGNYDVVAKIKDKNFEGAASETFVISEITGVTSANKETIRIFPNPASHSLFIESGEQSIKNSEIFIYNSLGNIIYRGILQEKAEINLENFTSGIYLLETLIDNTRIHKRFLVTP